MARYTVGVDFGTLSARALLVETASGREVATAVRDYPHGVIDAALPGSGVRLDPDWALQHPRDYIDCLGATVREVMATSGVDPADVIGIGIDFTACTMLPTTADGTPLCELPEWSQRPHAWVKLWKHHAAQPQADRLNALARERGGMFLDRYGGKISSEWFFPKALQILEEDPDVYHAADRLIEAQDWVIWQLAGHEARSLTAAGYKAIHTAGAYPEPDFLGALHPDLADVVAQKMSTDLHAAGTRVGGLTEQAAQRTGLAPGTAVAVANMDAHVSVPACKVTSPRRMAMVMGTSICHLVLGDDLAIAEGMCGVVADGVVPGWWGYEAGQPCVGDLFGWFVEHAVPGEYAAQARERGIDTFALLEERAAALAPGETGIVALDWWNGNRSTLVDVGLSGLLVGAGLATRAEDIYRALLESTAFGTRVIIDAFADAGVPVDDLVACGGLPDRSPLLMQIFADVTGRDIHVARSGQAPALGAAMYAAVAAGAQAGGYDSIDDAAAAMAHLRDEVYRPDPATAGMYERLYREYTTLYDHFGRGGNDVMHRLKEYRREARAAGTPRTAAQTRAAAEPGSAEAAR